jgi:DNA-binding CsgD family transcriptional regulator
MSSGKLNAAHMHPFERAARERRLTHSDSEGAATLFLSTLASHIAPIAGFCILWPCQFACVTNRPLGDGVTEEEVRSVSSEELASAFFLGPDGSFTNDVVGRWSELGHWPLERLPIALQRPPFLVPGVAKLTLPFHVGGEFVGFAGLSLPRKLTDVDRAWYAGCCVAVTMWMAAEGGARPEPVRALARGTESEVTQLDDVGDHLLAPGMPLGGVDIADPSFRLSKRELEIANYLAQGYSTINVGAILGVSVNTIRTHVRRIYQKLQVCSRVELVHRIRS